MRPAVLQIPSRSSLQGPPFTLAPLLVFSSLCWSVPALHSPDTTCQWKLCRQYFFALSLNKVGDSLGYFVHPWSVLLTETRIFCSLGKLDLRPTLCNNTSCIEAFRLAKMMQLNDTQDCWLHLAVMVCKYFLQRYWDGAALFYYFL